MMPGAGEQEYSVYGQVNGAGPEMPAGRLAIDGGNRITVVKAEPQFSDVLNIATATLNQSKSFKVRDVPPDAEPFSLYKKDIPRDAPEAREALLTVLRKDFGLRLDPA